MRIILRRVLKKEHVKMWIRFIQFAFVNTVIFLFSDSVVAGELLEELSYCKCSQISVPWS
jgi:hypothetical protein